MGPSWYAPTFWPYVVPTHRQSKQHPTNNGYNLTVTFRQGLYWLTILASQFYEAKITSIEDRLKGYSKSPLMGIEQPTPSFERSLITALTGDRTVDISGQVINLNTKTAFKLSLIHI